MFKILEDPDGRLVVITDNPRIADEIRKETVLNRQPVYFTGAPDKKVALGLAQGLEKLFGRPALAATVRKTFASDPPWSAQFIDE